MSKIIGTIGKIAGVVAPFLPPPLNAVATAVAVVAGTVSQLTAKKPPVRGAVNASQIAVEAPLGCIIGRSYSGGSIEYDKGYGATLDGVPNPYRLIVMSYGVGPCEACEAKTLDFSAQTFSGTAATGFWAGFLWAAAQLGAQPEAAALVPQFSGAPGWTASSKLSGTAAVAWSFKFDKKGKKWPNGIPPLGAIWRGPAVYDARLDSTRPGGSGSCRADDEDTWVFDANPALHAATYIIGRHQNGVKVFGIGDDPDSIDWVAFNAWANVCDVNGWEANGEIFESGREGERMANLRTICEAGAAEPIMTGAGWTVRYQAPRVPLDTITRDDYADAEGSFDAIRDSRDRPNGLIPKIRSEDHRWEMTSGELIQYAAYVTEDGEEITQENVLQLVTDADQGAQLTAYRLLDGRELGPIELPLKARFRDYTAGNVLVWDDPDEGIDEMMVEILGVRFDATNMVTTLTLASVTEGKDDFALGRTGTLPPAPTLTPPEDVAAVGAAIIDNREADAVTVVASGIGSGAFPDVLTSSDAGASATVSVAAHDKLYADGVVAAISAGSVTGLAFESLFHICYDDPTRAGGAVTFIAEAAQADAMDTVANPGRVYLGPIITPANGGPSYRGGTLTGEYEVEP